MEEGIEVFFDSRVKGGWVWGGVTWKTVEEKER